uniref:Ig-like domain-containing protein n=1 Tax=Poecilia latipinna TaxID=48699 RepID=A0A3B3UJG4_9TELE
IFILINDISVEVQSSTLTFNLSAVFCPADEKNITAEPGQNVTLPCRAAGSTAIIAVEWIRTDLGSEYVLYRDGQINPGNQNPSYQNRVDLLDRQMKDRDVSLVLKNLTTNDTGTYQCQVQNERSPDKKLISIVKGKRRGRKKEGTIICIIYIYKIQADQNQAHKQNCQVRW